MVIQGSSVWGWLYGIYMIMPYSFGVNIKQPNALKTAIIDHPTLTGDMATKG